MKIKAGDLPEDRRAALVDDGAGSLSQDGRERCDSGGSGRDRLHLEARILEQAFDDEPPFGYEHARPFERRRVRDVTVGCE